MPYTGDSHIVTCSRDGQVRLAELSATGVCKATKRVAQHRGAAHKVRRLSVCLALLLRQQIRCLAFVLRQRFVLSLCCYVSNFYVKLALLEDSSHVFYSCGEDAAVLQIDLRAPKPTKYVPVLDLSEPKPLKYIPCGRSQRAQAA